MTDTDSLRFCESCGSVTLWKFNKNIHHSRCDECGSQFGRRPRPTDKDFKVMKNKYPHTKFLGHDNDTIVWGVCNLAHPQELDDELDLVNE